VNGGNKSNFLRLGLVTLVALLALCAASAPASAQAVAIDPDGTVVSGVATVTGTFTAPADTTVQVEVQVDQFLHGQVVATAITEIGPITADGSTQSWTASMFSLAGYKTGHAQVTVRLLREAFHGFETLAISGATVQLHPH
jgi:hypothetical protein